MSEQEPSMAEESSTTQDPLTTEDVTAQEDVPTPDVPSAAPVPGWTRGVDGNWWPPTPPRHRPPPSIAHTPRRRKRGRRVVGGIGFAVFVLAVLAVVAGIVAVLVNYGDDSGSSTNTAKGAHAIGDTARTASVDATVTGVQNPYAEPNSATQPRPGFHFVAIELTMTNTSTKDLVVAPDQLFQLTDAADQKQLRVATSVPTLEGVLVALGTRQGGVVFAVPNSARAPLIFRVKGEPGAGGVTFAIP